MEETRIVKSSMYIRMYLNKIKMKISNFKHENVIYVRTYISLYSGDSRNNIQERPMTQD